MDLLDTYKALVPFLGQALGRHCEVVLHDLRNPDHSVIAIANGEISGRSVGAPATDFILKLLQEDKNKQKQYMTNYYGKSFNGHVLRSSTYLIHDETGKCIGSLCLNYDVEPYLLARRQIDEMVLMDLLQNVPGLIAQPVQDTEPEDHLSESMYQTVDDAIEHLIQNTLKKYRTETKRLSQAERLEIVRELYKNGLFVLKGSVYALAQDLGVSEPTIYRYLNRVKKED